ncbi:MAG: MFS transporter [Haloarculaceae archaeon]
MSLDRRVVALGFARLADSFGNALLIVVLPLYVASGQVSGWSLGLSTTVVTGVVLAAFGIFDSVVQPFAGYASDRSGRRRAFVLGGLVVLAVTNAAFAATASYLGVFAVRVLQGLGVGVTVTASVALIDEYSTTDDRGANFGIFNALRLIGFGTGPLVAGLVVARGPYDLAGHLVSGFTAAFDVAAVAAVLGLVVVGALVRDPETTQVVAGGDISLSVLDGSGGLDPVFALGLATLFVAVGISLFATIEPEINHRLGQGPTAFGGEFAAFVLAFVVVQPIVGRLSDRYGRKPFIVAGLVLVTPVLFAQGFVWTTWAMGLLRTIQGAGAAMTFGPALALAGDLATTGDSGTKLSVLTAAFGLGAGVGPLVAGPLMAFGFAGPFVVGAALSAVGAAIVFTQVEETVPGVGAGGAGDAAPARHSAED